MTLVRQKSRNTKWMDVPFSLTTFKFCFGRSDVPFLPDCVLMFGAYIITLAFFSLFFFLSRLSLEVKTLNLKCEQVETAKGVVLSVTGVAEVSTSES